jgi:hypothetical protein
MRSPDRNSRQKIVEVDMEYILFTEQQGPLNEEIRQAFRRYVGILTGPLPTEVRRTGKTMQHMEPDLTPPEKYLLRGASRFEQNFTWEEDACLEMGHKLNTLSAHLLRAMPVQSTLKHVRSVLKKILHTMNAADVLPLKPEKKTVNSKPRRKPSKGVRFLYSANL